MNTSSQSPKKIILISDDRCDIANIKSRLDESVDFPCSVWQYPKIQEALDVLREKKLHIDLIILDLALVRGDIEDIIYKQVGVAAGVIPIIVISGDSEQEHSLAVKVIEAGATDQILRGQFHRMIDAIRFALIRTQYAADSLSLAVAGKVAEEASRHEEKDEKSQASIKQGNERIKTLDKYISWMSGDYSASGSDKK